jgi:phytoene/squalene synthetase
VPGLLETVRHPENDELAEARAELKLRLLGPAEPSSQERFNDAVRALCGEARDHRARVADRLAAVPGQRTGTALPTAPR